MSTKIVSKSNGCIFLWKIVNISHCWLKRGERLESPKFIANALEGAECFLCLYPNEVENNVEIYIGRKGNTSGPLAIDVRYRVDLVSKNGESLMTGTTQNESIRLDYLSKVNKFKREKIFGSEKALFLLDDTLAIKCSIWNKDESLEKPEVLSARTVFKVNRRFFVFEIEEFSNLQHGVRNKFKDDLVNFDLVLKEGLDFEKTLVLNSISINKRVKYFSFKVAIIDSEGEKECCGKHEYFESDLLKGVFAVVLFAKRVLENKRRYLPDDTLTLDCECVYSDGDVLDEYCAGEIISTDSNVVVEKDEELGIEKAKPQQPLVLANDLKTMYSDGDFSDTELRTSSKAFPAHKFILIARSPVFRRMFSNDMRENNSGHIDIDDLEDDTIHRMLLYIYTDTLEDMQLEIACKLYVAADKYEILSLRNRCASFLEHNLCPTKACDVLLLASLHQDKDLKTAVQDYILKYDKEVFFHRNGNDLWIRIRTWLWRLCSGKFVPIRFQLRGSTDIQVVPNS